MTPIPVSALSDALHWRYATKKYDPSKKIPAETWAALEQALVLAPSSYGLQPWKFVVVSDPETRKKLSAAAHGQPQPVEASHYVVFAGRKGYDGGDIDRFLARVSEVRGTPRENLQGFSNLLHGSIAHAQAAGTLDTWMFRQSYLALGLFIAAAALLGVDTSPMEGIEPAKFDEILGLGPTGYTTLVACAAGYRAADDKYASQPKVRFKAEDVIIRA